MTQEQINALTPETLKTISDSDLQHLIDCQADCDLMTAYQNDVRRIEAAHAAHRGPTELADLERELAYARANGQVCDCERIWQEIHDKFGVDA